MSFNFSILDPLCYSGKEEHKEVFYPADKSIEKGTIISGKDIKVYSADKIKNKEGKHIHRAFVHNSVPLKKLKDGKFSVDRFVVK